MQLRKIIKIDEDKCNGCGQCIPNCPEGAIQVIDEKARLISDLFCDGLGACIGYCPQGAITIEEREAGEYNERMVMENIVKQGRNVIIAHLKHLKGHGEHKLLQEALNFLKVRKIEIPPEFTIKDSAGEHNHGSHACPGSKIMDLRHKDDVRAVAGVLVKQESQLSTWPVQIKLVPVLAPYFEGSDILIAADCVPFAYADFHAELLKGKTLLVGCPKLDDIELYRDKISQILKDNRIKSVTYAHMEVPCCSGLIGVIKEAIASSGKDIRFEDITISIKGERLR